MDNHLHTYMWVEYGKGQKVYICMHTGCNHKRSVIERAWSA